VTGILTLAGGPISLPRRKGPESLALMSVRQDSVATMQRRANRLLVATAIHIAAPAAAPGPLAPLGSPA
jgi:hypothetical protein